MMIEEKLEALLKDRGFDFAVITPTKNGMNKNIMDATKSVREFLSRNAMHDYIRQAQGSQHKVTLTTYFVTKSGLTETKASLYRPKTKKGDPRIWFSGLDSFCAPYDKIALLTDGGRLYVLNISNKETEEILDGRRFFLSAEDTDISREERQEHLSFSTNAKLGKLLGRELITNNVIAVFELIKNSYDAFASEVVLEFSNFNTEGNDGDLEKNRSEVLSSPNSYIRIIDNGIGMTFNDIKTKWMQVGTISKEGQGISELHRNGRVIRRVINGEKGIGRFGTDKLGAVLRMESISELGNNLRQVSLLEIDWNEFNDYSKELQDFSFTCTVKEVPSKEAEKTGLTLVMTELREKWTGNDILKLKKQMRKLISPFSQEQDDFKIYLKFGDRFEIITNDSLDYADTGITVSLTRSGEMNYSLFDSEEIRTSTANVSPPSFGPVELKISYMDAAAKRAFSAANKMYFHEYGNIKLFRDNFRILPYGEQHNDWLGIDNKHAQAVFRSLATRDIIGYIQITKEHNPALRDATNRQGLNEDTPEFEAFKAFVWSCLDLLSNFIFARIKLKAEQQGQLINHKVVEIKDDIISFKRVLPSLYDGLDIPAEEKNDLINKTIDTFNMIEKNIDNVDRANKQLENQISVISKIAGTEHMLYDIIHAIKNKLAVLEALIGAIFVKLNIEDDFPEYDNAKKTMKDLSDIVFAALKRTTPERNKREVIIISEVLRSYIKELQLVYGEMEIQMDCRRPLRIRCNLDGLKTMLDNLFNNSMKALEKLEKKAIRVRVEESNDFAVIYFSDNGIGIPDDVAPFIFTATFSTTSGTGIGLATAAQYINEHGGTIAYIKESELGGATFKITLPLYK